jgi:hypothetical protein
MFPVDYWRVLIFHCFAQLLIHALNAVYKLQGIKPITENAVEVQIPHLSRLQHRVSPLSPLRPLEADGFQSLDYLLKIHDLVSSIIALPVLDVAKVTLHARQTFLTFQSSSYAKPPMCSGGTFHDLVYMYQDEGPYFEKSTPQKLSLYCIL